MKVHEDTAIDARAAGRIAAAPALFARLGRSVRALPGVAVDFLLPPRCVACRARTAAGQGVCPQCWGGLDFIEAPLCARTGRPFVYDPGEGIVSAAALARPSEISRVRAAVRFGDVSRLMVHGLKYNDRLEFGPVIARLMLRAGRDLVEAADLVVPVPLHRRRQWQRRYNQSALLARRIAQLAERPCDAAVLERVRATRAQVGLDWAARRRNVRKAFAVRAGARRRLEGRNFLLVDDVFTTGATAQACARALLDAGAARVDLVVFAMVCDPVSPQA